jgi:hypothetical protein
MANTWISCKPFCAPSDPTKDTVKVDISKLSVADKENVGPLQNTDFQEAAKSVQRLHEEEAQRKAQKEAEERRKREEAEATAKAAAKAAWEERLRQEAAEERARKEAEEERLRQEAAELAQKEAEEERLRQEAAEVARKAAEEAAAQERKRASELDFAERKMAAWCKTHGYESATAPKSTMRGGKKYALHTAVKHEDCEAVKMLQLCGAEKDAKDSKGQTAMQLAEKMKPGKTREMILTALR